jgi:hypothetical protein
LALLVDSTGWHTASKLDVPDNITPIFLPSRTPEISRELAQDSVGILSFVIDNRSKLAFNVEHSVPYQPGAVEVRSGVGPL